jgi:ATP-dependent DNA helicase RecG
MEETICPKASHDDQRRIDEGWILKDEELLSSFLKKARRKAGSVFEGMSDEKLLSLLQVEQGGKPTLSGLLVFSKYPQAVFPGLCITAVSYPGLERGDCLENGVRFLDNRRIVGSFSSMLEESMRFVMRNARQVMVHGQKDFEYPMKAVREALLNALMHRDYSPMSENSPVRLEMFADRLEIINMGGLYGGISIEDLGKECTLTRNACLINILEILEVTENRFSGIPVMYKEMEKAELMPPKFLDHTYQFKVIFYNASYQMNKKWPLSKVERSIVQFTSTPKTRKEIAAFLNKNYAYTSNHYLKPMVEKGILVAANNQTRNAALICSEAYRINKAED